MKLYYPITVDLYNIYPLPIMPAQQANIGRGAQVTLKANGAAVVPENETVNIYIKKPDGTKVYADCTVAGNQIQVDFSQQMLLVPGMLEVELQMIDADGNNITTPIFLIQNQRSNIDYAGITSSDEFTALVTALAEVEDLKKNGLKGDAATVTVGTTTTGEPGTDAAVNNSGTTGDAILNFTVPRGADGSMWYYGDDITGTSTSGAIFAGSGITAANVGDKYLNISTGDDKGNVYTCTVAGDAETAQWAYIGNIEGPQGPEGPAGTQEIIFAARAAFPETGQENMLYIDNTVNPALAYVWNGSNYIPAGGGGAIAAADVTYDNTSSSLEADTVQEAIDANAAAISSLNSSMPQIHAGSYVPELVSGGDSLAVSSGNIQYFVVGNLCFLSCALWATINNPNADDIKLSLPPGIIPTSIRNYGWVGYHQSKAIDTMYVMMDNSGSGIAFEKPTATGSSGIKGTDMNNMTIQFSVVFAVNTSLDL